ncbi:hypothetical protein F3N42_08840 [Marinihelvus fidelis]|uniref:Uncharacterized protein n=1 Tax=Marinihelvus fidelis TaxID=2613842 RepID=A0A5N0TC57_9GAMM|nr:hypothetical protein [Marinihelvus fidelis]KAA9131416.1 hypothetical protein F3N42_08840 [Marinihelvus fidelis]
MSLFEFIVGFYVVIAGLGVTLLVRSVGQMIESRDHIKPYWIHSCWLAFIFVMHVNSWFMLWAYRDQPSWSVAQLLLLLSVPILLYLASHVSVPEIPERSDERFDMRFYYYRRHSILFGLLALSTTLSLVSEYLLLEHARYSWLNLLRGLGLVLLVAGLVSRRPAVHVTITVIALGILICGLTFIGRPIS